jgi:predicted membrane protein DUF2231
MFDTISGLPVHALVVHAVVVLLPLMALVTIAFTVRPRWRAGLPWAILGNLVTVGAAYTATKSGGNLQARLSNQVGQEVAVDHGNLGSVLPNFAVALLVASVLAYLLVGRTPKARRSSQYWEDPRHEQEGPPRTSGVAVALAVVLVVGAGAAAGYWTFRVGDSGARAVWEDTIANTKAP